MTQKATNITRTVALSMIVGGAMTGAAAMIAMPKKKKLAKKAKKTLNNITTAVENIAGYMMK